MLTDTAIRALRSQKKLYKVNDRDGMYVVVQPSGAIVFRYDYRLNGRRETLTLGRYGPDGLSLASAREKPIDAKRAISEGRSPAQKKQHDKRRLKGEEVRRVRREVVPGVAHGRQHACHAALNLRARHPTNVSK